MFAASSCRQSVFRAQARRVCRILIVTEPEAARAAMDEAVELLGSERGTIRLAMLLRRQTVLLSLAASSGVITSHLEEEVAREVERQSTTLVAGTPQHIGICCSLVNDRDKQGLERLLDDSGADTMIIGVSGSTRRRMLTRSLRRQGLATSGNHSSVAA